jgi:hypothetical protein
MAFARGDGDVPFPKPVRSPILASKSPGIWRMSVYRDGLSAVEKPIAGRRAWLKITQAVS